MTFSTILQVIGAINGGAFALVALSDVIVGFFDVVTHKLGKYDTQPAREITKWWMWFREIYLEYRQFLDRISSYSRPDR